MSKKKSKEDISPLIKAIKNIDASLYEDESKRIKRKYDVKIRPEVVGMCIEILNGNIVRLLDEDR